MNRDTRIRSVTVHVLEAPIDGVFAYSQAWYTRRGAMLVEITTEAGLTGWGEAFGPARITAAVVEHLKPLVIGADALACDALWERMYNGLRDHGQRGVVVEAISAIDIALWDLRGQHFQAPIHALLGGPIRSEVAAYATGLYRRRDDDHARYLCEEAAGYVERGFGAVKLKTGFGVDHDIRMTQAVRDAIGSDVRLMVDANHGYDVADALRYGRAVADLDIGWFEEPVMPEDIDGYVQLRAALPMPIAGGEASFARYGFRDLLVRRAVDILQPDVAAAGGISECKKIFDMASAFGVRCNPHVWGSGVTIAASLQLLAVVPDVPPGLFPVAPMLEFDCTEHPIRQAILTEPLAPAGGRIRIPDRPGLGITIDRDALARFAVR
ncbi:MAG: mandelate racemase/muconate lactonizing enzyme family protein [Lautropia sp.]